MLVLAVFLETETRNVLREHFAYRYPDQPAGRAILPVVDCHKPVQCLLGDQVRTIQGGDQEESGRSNREDGQEGAKNCSDLKLVNSVTN